MLSYAFRGSGFSKGTSDVVWKLVCVSFSCSSEAYYYKGINPLLYLCKTD